MILDDRLFNEFDYLQPGFEHDLAYCYSNTQVIETMLKLSYPKKTTPYDKNRYTDYQNFIDDLLKTAELGIIPVNSVSLQALELVQAHIDAGKITDLKMQPLNDLSVLELNYNRYFLTNQQSDNPIDIDLFGGTGDDNELQKFLDYVNVLN